MRSSAFSASSTLSLVRSPRISLAHDARRRRRRGVRGNTKEHRKEKLRSGPSTNDRFDLDFAAPGADEAETVSAA